MGVTQVFAKKESSVQAKNWYKDKYQFVLVQRNILAVISVVALFCSAIAVFAVMRLTPQKSVEPFVIQIDEKSGIVERVDPVTRTELTANEAIEQLIDHKGLITRRYGARPGSCYLIRPDQHVAARWQAFNADNIRAALARATAQEIMA